jgi:hypothetical protein
VKRHLRSCILGAGSRLESSFDRNGGRFAIGNAISAESADVGPLAHMWQDVFGQARASGGALVLVRILAPLPLRAVLNIAEVDRPASVIYCTFPRPAWLPLAL